MSIDSSASELLLWGLRVLNWRQIKYATQLKVTWLFYTERLEQSLWNLADHQVGRLLRKLHEAILNDIVDEEINVPRDALLIRQLSDSLLN